MSRFGLLAFVSVLIGCGWWRSLTSPDALTLLHRNQSKWAAAGIKYYTFRFQRECECTAASLQPVIILVENGSVTEVRNAQTSALLPAPTNWPTIDSLFSRAERDVKAGYRMTITYDGQFHFPGVMSGDYPQIVDEEYTFRSWALSPLAID